MQCERRVFASATSTLFLFRYPKALRIVIVIALCALLAWGKYLPNVLNEGGTLHHFHAYFNSIYNVAQGIPFSEEYTGIYGHHAFFSHR